MEKSEFKIANRHDTSMNDDSYWPSKSIVQSTGLIMAVLILNVSVFLFL